MSRQLKIAAAQLGPLHRSDSRPAAVRRLVFPELALSTFFPRWWMDLAADLKKTMFNVTAHRRPEHYRLIVERTGAEVTPAD